MKKGIAVCFPGTGYTCRETLFVLCARAYEKRRYDVVTLDYGSVPFDRIESNEEAAALAVRAGKRLPANGQRGIRYGNNAGTVYNQR